MKSDPLWKQILILISVFIGLVFALPNFYSQDPAIEISTIKGGAIDDKLAASIKASLENNKIEFKRVDQPAKDKLLVRFNSPETQLQAKDLIEATASTGHSIALTPAPDLPVWLDIFGVRPMYLGLDLRGGIHVLIDVDMDAALKKSFERYTGDIRSLLRREKVRYTTVSNNATAVIAQFKDAAARDNAQQFIATDFPELVLQHKEVGETFLLEGNLTPAHTSAIKKTALEQNITTLRNRINALGVAEPIIQQQGERRIVVELPGVQDPSRLKEVMGATATLEYRLADTEHSAEDAERGQIPVGFRLYKERNGRKVLLSNRVIITGDQITDASSGFDQRSGQPAVFVSLDGLGAKRMRDFTTENVGKPMAVVFNEIRTEVKIVEGKPVRERRNIEEVISIANILEPFGRRFQTTGLDSSREAHDLALLLRSGALAAPIEIVEERTVGPSLGQDNIDKGLMSALIGTAAVAIFMAAYYSVFGIIADLVLLINVILILALMSMIQATLTMPGIAGIVLTVGMAVDANVLINERIREELRLGNSPLASIAAGYEKAWASILDGNVTTLIAGIVLFGFGTGPIKGFAVVLTIGILTTLFTAVTMSRIVVNHLFGRQRLQTVPV
jgi:preprotein translocase subunit SecD